MSLLDTRTPIVHPSYAGPATRSPRTVAARPGFGMLAFGVLLPAAVIVIECVSRMCAGTFFDPLPTPGHLALALSVPLGNAAVWAVLRRSSPGVAAPRPRSLVLGMANGFVIAAASYYTLLFLPLIPFAVIAIILYGLGLLPLAPLLGLIAALRLRQQVAEPSPDVNVARTPGLWRGFALGGVAVVALVAPAVLTQYGLGRAASTDPVVSESGVRFMRRLGS
jgi:hypothetical protein